MRFIRSLLFNVYIYLLTVVMAVVCLPILLLPNRRGFVRFVEAWCEWVLKPLWFLCRIKVEIRGLEHLPTEPVLFAAKHQSVWETLKFFSLVKDPAFILKRELLWIPFFGWYLQKAGMIAVDRSAAAKALKSMVTQARQCCEEGRAIVIFPEGTRTAPGAAPDYKSGIAALYTHLDLPCVPVATNSGLCWPRRTIVKHPGTMVLEFLPPIEAGLDRKTFMAELEARKEAASNRLLAEAEASPPEMSEEPAIC